MEKLDLDFVRNQFPAFSTKSLENQLFFENAGGSYMCQQVMDRFQCYFEERKVQPYYAFLASKAAGEEMDMAHTRFANYLNVDSDEIMFGPSTSQNTYVLAQAFRDRLKAGDVIIVSEQEHEANSGVWRRLNNDGIEIRIWRIDRDDGSLKLDTLIPILDEKVCLVTMTHCSNLIGYINNIKEISDLVHKNGSILLVDGVSYCPHGLPDVKALGADIYLFSTYKTYGPHQGVMVIRRDIWDLLEPQAHYFNKNNLTKWMVPAGPDHAQIAAANGIIDYFDALDCHHGGKTDSDRPRRVEKLLQGSEKKHIKLLLDYITDRKDLRLIGPSEIEQRAPTISFISSKRNAYSIAKDLAIRGVMVGAGHYYAVRLFDAMGIDSDAGAIRMSFTHYTSEAEIRGAITALKEVL